MSDISEAVRQARLSRNGRGAAGSFVSGDAAPGKVREIEGEDVEEKLIGQIGDQNAAPAKPING